MFICVDCGKECRSRAGLTLHRKKCLLAASSLAPPPPPPPQHFVPVTDVANAVPPEVLADFSPSAPRMNLTFSGSSVTAAACAWCGRSFGTVIGCSQHQRKTHKDLYLRAVAAASSVSVTPSVHSSSPSVPEPAGASAAPSPGVAAGSPCEARLRPALLSQHASLPSRGPSPASPPSSSLSVSHPSVADLDGPLRSAIRDAAAMVPPGSPLSDLVVDAVDSLDHGSVVENLIQPWLLHHHPVVWRPRQPPRPAPVPRNKREADSWRRSAFQRLWARKRKDAARMALDGLSPGPTASRLPAQMEDFWRSLLTTPSTPDSRPVPPPAEIHSGLAAPVSPSEVLAALKVNGKTSPGPDKLDDAIVRSWTIPGVCVLLNCFLLEERLPATLHSGRITFIPKVPSPTAPSQYRPITVSSLLVRIFHRVLASRFAAVVALDPIQFAFQSRDGVLEATSALHAALVETKSRQGLAVACLDLQKAFDSVSTSTILRCASGAGFPVKLLRYLNFVYDSTSVQVIDAMVTPTRGVRQGDPLSPLLFNLVVQEVLRASRPDLCLSVLREPLHCLAYADDVFLLAPSRQDLQLKVSAFASAAGEAGLQVNLAKSFVLVRPASDPRVLDQAPLLAAGGEIRALSPTDSFDYLGVRFTPDGLADSVAFDAFRLALRNLDSSGLTVGQKLCVLRDFLVPRSLHRLFFERINRRLLRRFDTALRHAVRRWLRMPGDTPLGAFHASVASGGLGMPCFLSWIPLLRRARFAKLGKASWPFLRAVGDFLESSAVSGIVRAPVKVRTTTVVSKVEAARAWSEALLASRDGKALADLPSPSVRFLRDPSSCFPRVLVDAVHLRYNAVPCRARASRGARRSDVRCRRCAAPLESTAHIVQKCHVTHAARVVRHDRIVARLVKALERQNFTVLREPQIPVGPTFVQPDIVAWHESGGPTVLDVQVCGDDNASLAYDTKIAKYSAVDSAILRFVAAAGAPSTSSVSHQPAIISFRGVVYSRTLSDLRALQCTDLDVADCCLLALSGSARASAIFFGGT